MSRRSTLIRYILPSVVANVSFFLFTIIDGVFVGRGVGTDAVGAVNIVFPYIMIFDALTKLVSIGGMTILAVRIGRGDNEGANIAFRHSAAAVAVVGTLFCIGGTVACEPICRLLGADDSFVGLCVEYLFWYSAFLIPCGLNCALMGFCRNDGAPELVSAAMIAGTLVNVVGDWLLIFPLHMGLKGAAIATGASQTLTLVLLLPHYLRKDEKKGRLSFGRFSPDFSLYGSMVKRGLPECVSCFSVPVCTILMNHVLVSRLGTVGVNTYSVISYVASFSVSVFVGVAEGIQPLFGQSYGRGDEESLRYYYKRSMIISVLGSVLIAIPVLLFENELCTLYAVDDGTREMVLYAMPRFIWGFAVQAVNAVIASYLYSTTRSGYSLALNILRSFGVNVAVILLVPQIFGAEAVWFTFGIYEAIAAVAGIIMRRHADSGGISFGEE